MTNHDLYYNANIYATSNTALTTMTNTILWNGPVYSDPLTFRYEPAYKVPPERAVDVEKIGATTETDLAWLKRRVAEISWVPA